MNVFAPRLFWTGGSGGGVWLLLPLLLSVTITVDVVEALQNCNSCEPSYCTDVSVMIWGIYYPKYSCSLCKVTFYTIWGECIPCTNNCISCDATECLYCYPGYYISGGACLLCNSCVAGQAQTRPCLNGLNTICATCASNQIAVNLGGGEQECRDCPAGTYRTPDKLSCATCTQCTSLQYVPAQSDCTSTQNRVCTDCPDNKATKNINSGLCDTCRPGYFLTNGLCTQCSSLPCDADRYQDCTNAVRTCNICAGMVESSKCALGYGPNPSTCPAGTTQNSACEPCPAGSERPNLTPLKCSKCSDGFYKTVPGTANCQLCTNAPVNNSFYAPWGNTLATTATCEWYYARFKI